MKNCILYTFLIFILLGFPVLAQSACTGASPTWSCPAVAADIANLVAGTGIGPPSIGDTVNVAAGTIANLGTISYTGYSIIGAGKDVAGTIIQDGHFALTKHATGYVRVSAFRFTNAATTHITIDGSPSSKPWRVDHTYQATSNAMNGSNATDVNVNGGLYDHNDFLCISAGVPCFTGADVFAIQTGETWNNADPTIGANDTTGERNIYIEDNAFTGVLETAPDCDVRARCVIRDNDYYDSSIVFHSGSPSDTTSGGGVRHYEVYDNRFHRVDQSTNSAVNKWVWPRGLTGVIANNAMDDNANPHYNKVSIRLSTNCPATLSYPLEFQIGQINNIGDSTPDFPLMIFGNTGTGSSGGDFLDINESGSGGGSCANPEDYIQVGRDYVTSNTWGWTAYTYPHPLQGGSSPTLPSHFFFGPHAIFWILFFLLGGASQYGSMVKKHSHPTKEKVHVTINKWFEYEPTIS